MNKLKPSEWIEQISASSFVKMVRENPEEEREKFLLRSEIDAIIKYLDEIHESKESHSEDYLIKLEHGKRYVCRNGIITTPIDYFYSELGYEFACEVGTGISHCYFRNGRVYPHKETQWDLISEYTETEKQESPEFNEGDIWLTVFDSLIRISQILRTKESILSVWAQNLKSGEHFKFSSEISIDNLKSNLIRKVTIEELVAGLMK